jgi:uncharacterized integral membrane protein
VADDTKTKRRDEQRSTGNMVRLGIAVLLVAALVAFVFDNRHRVNVGFVFTDSDISLIWVLLATLVLGAILDRLVRFRRRHHN